eukprot:g15459.t1
MPPPRCSLWSMILQNKSALWDDLFIRGLPFAETKLGQLADFLLLQSPERFAAYVLQAMFLHDDHSGAGKAGTNRFYQSLSPDQADKANAWLLAELKRLTEAVEAEDVVVETDQPERSATSSSAAAERKETRAFVRDVVVRLSLQYWGKFLLDRDYSQLLHPTDAMVSRIVRATPAKTVAEIKESILEPGAFAPSYATSSSPAGKNTAPYPFCSSAEREVTEQCNGDVDAFELNLVKTSIAAPPSRPLSIRSASFTLLEDEVPEVVPPSPPTSTSSSSGLSTQLANFAGPCSSAYSSMFAPSTASSSPPSDIDQLYLRTHYSAGSLLKDVVDVFGTTFPGADGETAQQRSPRRVEPQRPTNFEIWRQIRDSAAGRYLTATGRLKDFLTAEMKRRTFHLRKEARENLGTVWYLYNPRPGAVSGLFSEAGYREMEDLLVLFERFGPASHSSYRMLKKPSNPRADIFSGSPRPGAQSQGVVLTNDTKQMQLQVQGTEDVRMTPSMRDILYLARRHRVFREGIEAIADPEGGRWAHWNSQVATGRKEMWTVVYLHLKFADHLGPLASTLAHKYWQWFGTGGCAPASATICHNNDEYGNG